jgi:hypothetical protein
MKVKRSYHLEVPVDFSHDHKTDLVYQQIFYVDTEDLEQEHKHLLEQRRSSCFDFEVKSRKVSKERKRGMKGSEAHSCFL